MDGSLKTVTVDSSSGFWQKGIIRRLQKKS